MNSRHLSKQYHDHKNAAARRGISFLLTYEQWRNIWRESGHLSERGRLPHQYCMARFGDVGAYEIGNVRIITMAENRSEQVATPSAKQKMRAAKLGVTQSAETKAKRAASLRGREDTAETRRRKSDSKRGDRNPMFGKKATEATRIKLSERRRGRVLSEETKEKIRRARIEYWRLKNEGKHADGG